MHTSSYATAFMYRIGVGLAAVMLVATPIFADAASAASTADTNHDGYISTAEGIPFYGAVKYSLTTTGQTDAGSALALDRFPTASADGMYTYTRTFAIDPTIDPTSFQVVVHGIDLNHDGSYDGSKKSSLTDKAPFEATVPAACGVVHMAGQSGQYQTTLSPLNGSDTAGNVMITKNGDMVTVQMTVHGASANLPHAQHFHMGGNGTCPPNTMDTSMSMSGTAMQNALLVQKVDLLYKLQTLLQLRLSEVTAELTALRAQL